MSYRTTFLGTALALLAGCSSTEVDTDPMNPQPQPEAFCDARQLEAALAEAASAESEPEKIVQAGECMIEGSFVVPAGVTLAGSGVAATTIVGAESRPAIELAPGAAVRDLGIISKGVAGVIAHGDGEGEVTVTRVNVQADIGIGFGAERLAGVVLEDVTLIGPPSLLNDPTGTMLPTPDITGTHGVVLWTVAEASLRNVTSSSFSGFGALLINSKTTWSGGAAAENYGVGIMAIDGTTNLTDVKVNTTRPVQVSVPAYGALFVSKALMTGVPDETSTVIANLQGVDASDNEGVGIMYAGGKGLLIDGSSGDRNAFAGLVVSESSAVRVRGSHFNETKELTLSLDEAEITGGDGIQLMSAVHDVALEDVTLEGNVRGGLLVDLGDTELSQTTQTWSNVLVGGNPTFGALCQGLYGGQMSVWGTGEPVSAPWDEGIVRDEVQAATDAVFEIPLDVIGVVDPNDMPAPVTVVELGLAALTSL